MKKYLWIFATISILGTGTKYLYDAITDLSVQIASLKLLNKNLMRKNTSLVKKQASIKKKLEQRRGQLLKKKLSRAKHKIGKATTAAIPFVGTAAVIALTYNELQDYCTDILDYKAFENSIFEDANNEVSEEEKVLCSYDYEAVKNEVEKDLVDFKNSSMESLYKSYNQWMKD